MAVEKFWNAGLFYNGWNLTGQTNKLTLNRKTSTLDTSVFGVETRIYAPGQDEISVNASGWWYTDSSATSQAPDPQLFNSLGGIGAPLLIYPKNADGGPAWMFPAVEGTFNFFGAFGELAPFAADFQFAQNSTSGDRVQPCRGYLGLPYQTSTNATVTGTYVQLGGAVTASQYAVMCIHLVATDSTNVSFVLESDDNSGFATPTTRLTAALTAAGQSYIDDLQGPITTDTYYRIKVTRTGGTTFTAVGAFGVS